mmetsp:Transcript_335/g.659  ORF Transcript_335/g.659 Transcript_335/m.659 type:complete len:250 (+) Transcript_335:262-1011(+)
MSLVHHKSTVATTPALRLDGSSGTNGRCWEGSSSSSSHSGSSLGSHRNSRSASLSSHPQLRSNTQSKSNGDSWKRLMPAFKTDNIPACLTQLQWKTRMYPCPANMLRSFASRMVFGPECRSSRRSGVQQVVHSTRQRAVRTCNALFGNRFPTIAVEDLVERLPFEKDGPFRDRLVRFRSWLAARDEDCIAIVGHGYFFQRMFRGLKTEPLGNVEVRKCAFHVESLRFGMPEMLYEPQCEDSSDSSGCCA